MLCLVAALIYSPRGPGRPKEWNSKKSKSLLGKIQKIQQESGLTVHESVGKFLKVHPTIEISKNTVVRQFYAAKKSRRQKSAKKSVIHK